VTKETSLAVANGLSRRLNNRILLKREDEHSVFSFKCRGAYNRIFKLNEQSKLSAVVTASAGNHAQGVALAAKHLGLKSFIVMPVTTPQIKVNSVNALGGTSILHGDSYDEAFEYAQTLSEEKDAPFIHAFDSPDTIAGQGTVGMEICRQHPDPLHAVFVPIGGGGLISGVGVYLKYLRPDIKVIGVEPIDSAAMHDSLKQGKRVVLDQVGMFADGVAVKQVGVETFRLCQKYVDEVILVSVDEISAAVKDIFDDTRTVTEPSGALAVAGMKKYIAQHNLTDKSLVAIASGANVNFDRLRHIAERAELGEQREALFAVNVPEKPGSFRQFCKIIGSRSVTEFNYRYADEKQAQVFAGLELRGGDEERLQVFNTLQEAGYKVVDLTCNEMAKLHVRYMVGGHAAQVDNELLFRFEFPERPGALLEFLNKMGQNWNISLFHYRNHGAAYGRALVGMQVPSAEREQLQAFLDSLGYSYFPENDNPAYKAFLA
jgi:threonine dehydratase